MNERMQKLLGQALDETVPGTWSTLTPEQVMKLSEKFAKLLIEDVLDEVQERAYYTGDRDWSDEVDRPWIQLEYGYGELEDAKKGIFK